MKKLLYDKKDNFKFALLGFSIADLFFPIISEHESSSPMNDCLLGVCKWVICGISESSVTLTYTSGRSSVIPPLVTPFTVLDGVFDVWPSE